MKSHRTIALLGALLSGGLAAGAAEAQAPSRDTVSAIEAPPADTAEKRGGGVLGKVKGLAKNKIVRQVAKTAACTIVPGGQVIAGAIDAASSEGAGGAAQGVAGAATGSSCMPGMGMAPAAAGPSGGALGDAGGMRAAQMAAMAGGRGGGNAQMAAAMQMMQAQMAQMGSGGAGMPAGMPEEAMPAGAMPMPPGPTAIDVSSDLVGDLKKGKTVVRNIDWVPGGADVSPASADGFARAMAQVVAAIKQGGGSFRLDLYMDKESGDIVVRTLGPRRLAAVRAALVEGGAAPGAGGLQIGQSKKEKGPRLEIVKLK